MGRHDGRAARWAPPIILLVIAVGAFAFGLRGPLAELAATRSAPSGPVPPPQPGVAGTAEAVGAGGALTTRSAPVELRIPAIGLAAPLSAVGVHPDGTVESPRDFAEPGWFGLGPSPGELGSAVILGHVDSHRGPAVFFRLRTLRPGDQVDVRRADGVTAVFAVRRVATYPKEQFPAELVYGTHGASALQLVTCGGAFDTGTRSYRSNVVVFTDLVAMTAPGAGRLTRSAHLI